jgi:hypothetical protein
MRGWDRDWRVDHDCNRAREGTRRICGIQIEKQGTQNRIFNEGLLLPTTIIPRNQQ